METETKVVNGKEYTVEYIESQSRWAGTGYRNLIYRVVGTDDAVEEQLNVYCQEDGGFYTHIYYLKGFFSKRKAFGRKCKGFAGYYALPVEFVMAIGPDALQANMIALANVLRYAKVQCHDESIRWELSCGIGRRKKAIAYVLGNDLYNAFGIESMGQKNSSRVADFLLSL